MFKRDERIIFDLKLEIKKFSNSFREQANCKPKIVCENALNLIKALGKDSAEKKFQIVCLESDYTKIGMKIVKALKDMQITCNTLVLDSVDGDISAIKDVFNFKDEEIIILGDRKLINIARLYATSKNLNCHVILTKADSAGLFTNQEVRIKDSNKKLLPLKTIIVDNDLLTQSEDQFSTLYIKGISTIIPALDYKLRLLTSLEKYDKENYSLLRYVITLLLNISSFENPEDILIYSSLIINYLKETSDILSNNAYKSVRNILIVNSKELDEDYLSYVVLEKLVKLYFTFYNNDFYGLFSYVNYNQDVEKLASLIGVEESCIYANLVIPSNDKIDLLSALINKTRSSFLQESRLFMLSLQQIKQDFIFFKKKQFENKVEYIKIKEAICLAPYIDNKTTTLSLCRDFGLLACIK